MTYLAPPGSGSSPVRITTSQGAVACNGGLQVFPAITLPRAGIWDVHAYLTMAAFPAGQNWPAATILRNGAGDYPLGYFGVITGAGGNQLTYHFFAQITTTAVNWTTALQVNPAPSSGTWGSYLIEAFFVPTPSYPR